jgi:AraC-like DNA-binding protein
MALIEQTLRVRWYAGDVTPIGTHSTGWRSSPASGVVQIIGLRTTIRLPSTPPRVAEPGTALVIERDTYHCLDSVEEGRGVAKWASIDFDVLGGVSVLALFDAPMVRPRPQADALGSLCGELAAFHRGLAEQPSLARAVAGSALGMRMLEAVIAGASANARAAALLTNAQRLAPVLERIDERLAEPTSREQLARLAGLSPSRFHELFLAVMRESPMAYLQRRRVQRAQQLLIGGGPSVREVAAAVGFDDPFHFSRVFKRVTGQSPARYRAEMAAGLLALGPPRGGDAP